MADFPFLGSQVDNYGEVGTLHRSSGSRLIHVSALALASGSPKVATITSNADVEDEDTYSGTVDWLDISVPWSVVTDASGTGAELAILIADALNENALMGILASSVEASGVTVVITFKDGIDGTVAFIDNPTTDLSVGYTAAVAATQFKFGRAVVITGQQTDSLANLVVETFEGVDAGDPVVALALVLRAGNEAVFDTYGESTALVGPVPGGPATLAKLGGRNQYLVEAPAAEPSFNGVVYVEGANSAEKGRLLTSGSGTTVTWTGARWIGLDPNNSAAAIVEI